MTVGIAIQIVLQAVYFIVVTRTMGARSYGAFVSVSAMASIVAAFSGWGGDQLLIRTVSHARDQFPRALGQALIYFSISAPVLTVAAALVFPFLADSSIPWTAILLIVLSEVIFARANYLAVNCFQAFERGRDMASLGILLYALRAIAALVWSNTTRDPSPLSWAWFYMGASLLGGAVAMLMVFRRLDRPVWRVRWNEWKEGGFFALQMGSFVGFRDIDKPLVAALSGLSQAGLYAAAFRISDVLAVPVRALIYSTYVRFFQHGARGTRGSFTFALNLLPIGAALGVIAGIGIAAASIFAVLILGPNYHGVGPVLLLLMPLPLLYALYYIGADALITSGHIGYRTLIQLILPAFDISLCAVLVPRYGAAGAAAAATCTHTALVAVLWASLYFLARDEAATAANAQATATIRSPARR
ncbi:MAG TPA: oligosaccharide flippase family protein [Stellaceae bacterium]|nr:oligosaccharide flippase family protein [Stellaceae bacterium]